MVNNKINTYYNYGNKLQTKYFLLKFNLIQIKEL